MGDKWDQAARLIDFDPMRAVRYGMACRYLVNNGIDRSARILDFGCGEGSGISFLLKLGFKNLFGAEVSEERIRRARAKLPSSIQIVKVFPDSITLWKDNFFDAILSVAVIEHVEDKRFFVKELRRILKMNGKLIVGSDCFTWRILQLLGIYRSLQPYDKTLTFAAYRSLFEESGFRILHFETFNSVKRGFPYIGLIKSYAGLIQWGPDKNRREFDVCLEKKVDNSSIAFLKQRLLNFFNDENVFLLEKIAS